jgi:hypothetical protein
LHYQRDWCDLLQLFFPGGKSDIYPRTTTPGPDDPFFYCELDVNIGWVLLARLQSSADQYLVTDRSVEGLENVWETDSEFGAVSGLEPYKAWPFSGCEATALRIEINGELVGHTAAFGSEDCPYLPSLPTSLSDMFAAMQYSCPPGLPLNLR